MGANDIDLGNRSIAHFIDCNCLPTSVVGGGPAEAGTIQSRGHSIMVGNLCMGVIVDMCGPTSLRRNDLAVLRMSDINERMANLQINKPVQYIIFGDSAYKL